MWRRVRVGRESDGPCSKRSLWSPSETESGLCKPPSFPRTQRALRYIAIAGFARSVAANASPACTASGATPCSSNAAARSLVSSKAAGNHVVEGEEVVLAREEQDE